MVKEFERAGIPSVLITALSPIAHSLGANRVIPGTAVTHPLGDPRLPLSEEKALRRTLVVEALRALETNV
jgi:glycine reductase